MEMGKKLMTKAVRHFYGVTGTNWSNPVCDVYMYDLWSLSDVFRLSGTMYFLVHLTYFLTYGHSLLANVWP